MAQRDNRTLDLFTIPQPDAPLPASMDYRGEVAHLVGQILKDAEGDRYEIAAKMSRLQGSDVSKYMLDAYASESRDGYNMPFYLAPILETACDSLVLSNYLATKRGGQLLVGKETLNAELGKMERIKEEAARNIRDLKKMMGEME